MYKILFDNYRKYQKKNQDNFFKAFWKLPKPAIIIFIVIISTIIYAILSIFVKHLQQWYVWCLLLEILACVTLYFYTEYYQIKTSSMRLQVYKKYCRKINIWLKTTGLIVNKKNLNEIIDRINRDILTMEEKRNKRRDRIEKWIQILIIPILLAVFSELIREQTNLSVLISYALVLLISVGSLSLAFLCCYNIIDFFQKRKLEQLKSFSNDLQGIIDTQLEKKLFAINTKKLKVSLKQKDAK